MTTWTFTVEDLVSIGTVQDNYGKVAVAFRNKRDQVRIVRVEPTGDIVASALDALHIKR